MKRQSFSIIFLTFTIIFSCTMCAQKPQSDYPVKPVPFTDVQFSDDFWLPRMETNRKVTIPYAFEQCKETGRIKNFEIAGGTAEGGFCSAYPFDDSDVYKIIEGPSYSLKVYPDPELEKYLDELIAKIGAAQEDDGYLYTARTIFPEPPKVRWVDTKERWDNMYLGHELYNAGHMYEAAVAHFQATGKRTFLDIAIKNADLIESVFGPGKKTGVPGHQEIEIGLVKLYRVTGEKKYLDLARFFLDERGYPHERKLYGEYSQDHMPVIEQTEPVGHAVRAGYMYSGMTDVAALTEDEAYRKALETLWNNVVSKKMYLTGGIGSQSGGESFGEDYELPNATAYCETCAAIAHAFWNHRMFLLTGDAKYLDILERVLYNGILSGIALTGDLFFYTNPLESHGQHARSPWFTCACCPSNVTRFVPSVPGYVYATQGDDLFINLFVDSEAKIQTDSQIIKIKQETAYPWDGSIKITLDTEESKTFTLAIRIPGWARNQPVPSDLYRYMDSSDQKASVSVNGESYDDMLEKGFVRISRKWKSGDTIDIKLPLSIRRVLSHENVEENAGKVALERGPLAYCAEWVDNHGYVSNLVLEGEAQLKPEKREDLFNGVVVLNGKITALKYAEDSKTAVKAEQGFTAIPYYAWAHRGKGEMAVWIARDESKARILPHPTIASTSTVSVSRGKSGMALNDQWEPASSNDHSKPILHWWPNKGTKEWVQYDFSKPTTVSSVEVYWFDDTGQGECRIPESWRVLYKEDSTWKPAANKEPYGVDKDKFIRIRFNPVRTTGLRLEITLQEKFSAGLHEWRVN
jgi:DUF1680 family protein